MSLNFNDLRELATTFFKIKGYTVGPLRASGRLHVGRIIDGIESLFLIFKYRRLSRDPAEESLFTVH